jgi:hypothetical protein
MKWFAEVTQWKGPASNHVYLLNDSKSKMFAYVPVGSDQPKIFKAPIQIDVRGRKFRLNDVQFDISIKDELPAGRVYIVKGSKGDEYKVTELNGSYSCTCSGFKFRSQCRHIESLHSS